MSKCKNVKPSESVCYVFPIGSRNMLFRRTTNRYGRKGSFSNNHGYKRVMRDLSSGRFTPITT